MDPEPDKSGSTAKLGDETHSSASDHASFLKVDLKDVAPVPDSDPPVGNPPAAGGAPSPVKSVRWSPQLASDVPPPSATTTMPRDSNPYVSTSSSSKMAAAKNTMDTVRNVLGQWGKKVGVATKNAENFAENVWQHLKTGPSMVDAAMGRIAQGTKVIAEGGHEKIFMQTFDTVSEEKLQNSFACYLSTSAGPVMGMLYLSTAKLAFCSDNPLSYKVNDKTEWSYYKVMIPLHQLRAVNLSTSIVNRAEKYIQVISVDNHEFWFMGFVTYDTAASQLQEAFQNQGYRSV